MTNLKKLRAINYLLALSLIILSSCAKVPFKGLYTDNQFHIKNFVDVPLVVFHQADLKNDVSWKYLQIIKKKLTTHKVFIILKEELTYDELLILVKHKQLYDGFILHRPLLLKVDDDLYRQKIILNSGIVDLETDDYYLADLTKRYTVIEARKNKYLFINHLDKLSMPQDEREFQFYAENALLSMLKMRKLERKNKDLNFLVMASNESTRLIKEKFHDLFQFKTIPEIKPGFFSLGENLIQLCSSFYKDTNDCFNMKENPFMLENSILDERAKILKENSQETEAIFLNEKI